MNNNDWIIWNELVKTDYSIKYIEIFINYDPSKFYHNILEVKIEFSHHDSIEEFSNIIFKKYGIDIHVEIYNNSFEIELKNLTSTYQKSILDTLIFQPNVECVNIINHLSTYSHKIIELCNLPEKLSQLKILTSNTPFNLSNLPTGLLSLDLSESKPKLNLDYLPQGLKVLYLPYLQPIEKYNCDYPYDLKSLSNLPSSLIEIYIDNTVFKSINDLMKTFDEKIEKNKKM